MGDTQIHRYRIRLSDGCRANYLSTYNNESVQNNLDRLSNSFQHRNIMIIYLKSHKCLKKQGEKPGHINFKDD